MRPQRSSSGSAFIVDTKRRHIMTNAHVVRCTHGKLSCFPNKSRLHTLHMQVSNETTVHVRRPGNPKKWRAKVLCEGRIADLALVTVQDDHFWTDELLDLHFVDVPELQASIPTTLYGLA